MKLTIVGAGPMEAPDGLSLRALSQIQKADTLVFQSEMQKATVHAKEYGTLDPVFGKSEDYDDLYRAISDYFGELTGEVTFVAVGDGINSGISKRLVEDFPGTKIIPGPVSGNLVPEEMEGAYAIVNGFLAPAFEYNTDLPTLISDIDDEYLLEEIKLQLQKYYGDDGAVWQNGEKTSLQELKREFPCDLFLSALEITTKPLYTYADLEHIIARLRVDCPWDREQTHESIRVNLVEECFELLEAIDVGETDLILEEMGDVLLQVALHNQMEIDTGEVDKDEVTTGICTKMIRRHPHVYGQLEASTPEGVLHNWDKIKKREYGFTSDTAALSHVSNYIPALVRANKLLKKAAKYGYDYQTDIYTLFDRFMQKNGDKETAGKFLMALLEAFREQKMEPFMILNDACNDFIVDFSRFEAEKYKK